MNCFGSIENIFVYLDDILIFGEIKIQRDIALWQVLDVAMKSNITFNKAKLQFKVDKVNVVHTINMTNNIHDNFERETQSDILLKQLIKMCLEVWPKLKNKVLDDVKPYFDTRLQISYENNLLFLNERVFVLEVLKNCILCILYEAHLGWLELKFVSSKTVTWIIQVLKVIFPTHGVLEQFITDNMPFSSREFSQLTDEWGIKVITTSPRYPRSNGLVEKDRYEASVWMLHIDNEPHDCEPVLKALGVSILANRRVSANQLILRKLIDGSSVLNY
ncbi:Ribonuclease H-like domain,Integrase, catalytic core [Cinara cedri]|uniref:Ribonuclease H-like domain,Integrase, catalytic core n=1 Tax=Cinara cedri TaxID=506608 RepID=A0A5E4MU61_9HEMI|nr:Ribonuclease H-like domain,Integrase, catalytic core [Cinara cedri]